MTMNDVSTDTVSTRIPGLNGGTLIPFNPERGRELSRRRWEGMTKAARLGLADAGEDLPAVSKRSPLAVIRYLVEEHAKHASEPGARGAVSSFQQVVRMAYPEPEREAGAVAGGSGVTIHLDESTARAILDDMRRARELSAESE